MTGSLRADPRRRPATPLRRALDHELRRSRDLLSLYGILMTVALQCAIHLDLRIGFVLILLAVRLPADLADPVVEDGRQLRSSLGISRAHAVRARTLVVGAGQLLLVLGAAGVILLSDWAPGEVHWSTVQVATAQQPGPTAPTFGDHLVDIGLFSGAIAWTHALVGGEAFTPGARLTGRRAIAVFLGVCILLGLVLSLSGMLTAELLMRSGAHDDFSALYTFSAKAAQVIALHLALGGGITALALRSRGWVRRA